jgi:hypothetical protein
MNKLDKFTECAGLKTIEFLFQVQGHKCACIIRQN